MWNWTRRRNLSKLLWFKIINLSNRILPEGLKTKIIFTKGEYNPFRTLQYIDIFEVETLTDKVDTTGAPIYEMVPLLYAKADKLYELKAELYYINK